MRKYIIIAVLILEAMQIHLYASDENKTGTVEERNVLGSIGHALIMYVPNRVMDVLDIVRLRTRVGLGVAAGVRVTKPLSVFIGGYESFYFGLPGPRLKPVVVKPVGVEEYVGMQAGLADGTSKEDTSPNYSATEIGVSAHAWVAGFDIGIDPLEILDLGFGLLFIDFRGDDL